jgi:MFS family permease
MLACAIPSLFLYQSLGHLNLIANILLQTLAGAMVNGPYCLITTAVSADLGNSVKSSNAMATVTAIIDGTGSIGAGVGPLLVGILFTWSLDSIFYVAMLADLISLFLLLRLGRSEWRRMRSNRQTIN